MRDFTIENLVCIAPHKQIGFTPSKIERWLVSVSENKDDKDAPMRGNFVESWLSRANQNMTDGLCQICGRSVTTIGVEPDSGMVCVRYIIYPPKLNDDLGLIEFGGLFTLCQEHRFIYTMAGKKGDEKLHSQGITLIEALSAVVEQIREKNQDTGKEGNVFPAEEILKWVNNKKSQYEKMSWEWGFTWLYRRSLATRLSFVTDKKADPPEEGTEQYIDLLPQYAAHGNVFDLRKLWINRKVESKRKSSIQYHS